MGVPLLIVERPHAPVFRTFKPYAEPSGVATNQVCDLIAGHHREVVHNTLAMLAKPSALGASHLPPIHRTWFGNLDHR
jgi:hypothetical protein